MLKCDQHEKPRKTYVIPKVSKKRQAEIDNGTFKPKPKKPIKPKAIKIALISKTRQEALKTYRRRRDEFLKGKTCEFPGCNSKDVTLHHKRGRVGAFLADKRYFCALCQKHHNWVELHPEEAKKMNLSQSRLDKHKN